MPTRSIVLPLSLIVSKRYSRYTCLIFLKNTRLFFESYLPSPSVYFSLLFSCCAESTASEKGHQLRAASPFWLCISKFTFTYHNDLLKISSSSSGHCCSTHKLSDCANVVIMQSSLHK